MARKRMISPEIWENEDFGALSPLAKLLFIGMISLADDDGKGIASPQLLKSNLFPFDEKLRSTDIDKTLDEIGNYMSTKSSAEEVADAYRPLNERGSRLSIHFYKVEGKRYYKFTNWSKWQSINRPSPSRLPDPPDDGVGGDISSEENFNEYSVNIHGVTSEQSRLKKNIEKEKENNAAYNKARPCACEIEQTESVKASIEKIRVINALVEGQLRQNGITIPDGYENSVDLVLDALHQNGYAYDMVTITEEKFMTILTRIGQLFQKGERPTNLTSYVKAIVED